MGRELQQLRTSDDALVIPAKEMLDVTRGLIVVFLYCFPWLEITRQCIRMQPKRRRKRGKEGRVQCCAHEGAPVSADPSLHFVVQIEKKIDERAVEIARAARAVK